MKTHRFLFPTLFVLFSALLVPPLAAQEKPADGGQKKPTVSRAAARAAKEAAEAPSWAFEPAPGLPNVLILGDSISVGYTRPLRKLLEGKANVFRPMNAAGTGPANCGDTLMGLNGIDAWLAQQPKWDVIHFNWGLWDLSYRNPHTKGRSGTMDKVNGQQSIPPEEYGENLEKLVLKLKATGAKLIWRNTTLVPEGEKGRKVGDDVKYNEVAAKIMQKHGIATDDLWTLSKSFDASLFSAPGNVHYTAEGYKRLAEQVAGSIQKALSSQ